MNIVLLAGGASPEREISLRSGKAIYRALIELGHKVSLVDPALGFHQPKSVEDFFNPQLNTEKVSIENYLEAFQLETFNECDLVFIILHGKWGEDGTVQAILELMNIKYTGCDVLASAIAIDKDLTKTIVMQNGIKTPPWFLHEKNHEVDYKEIADKVGLPCVFKPNDQGSTIGFSLVDSIDNFEEAINLALKYSDKVLVEKYIKGRELTVSILGDIALPVIEVKPKHVMYDYECKYTKGMTEYYCPADLPEEITEKVKKLSLMAFNSCRCRTFGRVDFILDETNELYFLEINTIPGMTDLSLVPMAAKVFGLDFNSLIQRIIDLSLS